MKDMHEQNRELLRLHADRVKELNENLDERVDELNERIEGMRTLLTGTLAAAILGILAQVILHFVGIH